MGSGDGLESIRAIGGRQGYFLCRVNVQDNMAEVSHAGPWEIWEIDDCQGHVIHHDC